ncbi:MAG: Hsp33 family molecular chaperone HslO [Candidatus Binatia bacterium]
MADRLARFLTDDGAVRAVAAVTTDLCDEARTRHGTFPTATAALGRALTSALLLATTVKRDERLSMEFSGDGPLRGLLAEATPEGTTRGFAYRPKTDVPPRGGKLDVGGALGSGILCVMRVPLAGGSIYRSIVPLVSGEIGVDVASYLVTSEQTPSAVGVGVLVGCAGDVRAAGGYLLQGMPGADPGVLERLAARVEGVPPPSDLVRRGLGAVDILGELLVGMPGRVLEERAVRFQCRCGRDRVRAAIVAMGRDEIEALLAEGRCAEAVCEFCSTTYVVDEYELTLLLDSARPDGRGPDA